MLPKQLQTLQPVRHLLPMVPLPQCNLMVGMARHQCPSLRPHPHRRHQNRHTSVNSSHVCVSRQPSVDAVEAHQVAQVLLQARQDLKVKTHHSPQQVLQQLLDQMLLTAHQSLGKSVVHLHPQLPLHPHCLRLR